MLTKVWKYVVGNIVKCAGRYVMKCAGSYVLGAYQK